LYQGGTNNPLNVLFNPGFVSRYETTPATQLLLDLYKTTGETKQFPRMAGKTISYRAKGWTETKKVNLTTEEAGKLQEIIGKRTIYILTLMENDMTLNREGKEIKMDKSRLFSKMSEDDKIEAIYKMLNEVGKYGKNELIKLIGEDALKERAK
jgi:hypothetical protein